MLAYGDDADRHFAGLIASCLAYGRVGQILKSVDAVLQPLGPRPFDAFMGASDRRLEELYGAFVHRFTTGSELLALLRALRRFCGRRTPASALEALGSDDPWECHGRFVSALDLGKNSLLPSPRAGSPCKRAMLWWRWCSRRDAVDPGGFDFVDRRKLLVPLDTHLQAFGRRFGLTGAKNPTLASARQITAAFARCCPADPVKYDFAVTRGGIHPAVPPHQLPAQKVAESDGRNDHDRSQP